MPLPSASYRISAAVGGCSISSFASSGASLSLEDICRALSWLSEQIPPASHVPAPPPPVSVAIIRLAAAHRSRLCSSRPEIWRELERVYRQHLRPTIPSGEARHWDAALRMQA